MDAVIVAVVRTIVATRIIVVVMMVAEISGHSNDHARVVVIGIAIARVVVVIHVVMMIGRQ